MEHSPRPVRLECCCCGGDAGRWLQWYNRDTGYGMCVPCIERCRQFRAHQSMSEEEILSCYGKEGVNWGRQ